MICQRAIAPASKLATVRAFGQSTLAEELGVADADEDDLYAAMDWLLERQERIEDRLARRHLVDGELVLYDVSSSYFEGRCCELAALGYSRDGKRGTPQIIYGLLCDKPGRPIAVEVFTGELHDDKTLPSQIAKLKDRFGLSRVVVVSDRGMVTKANLELMREADGIDWITALKAPQIQKLARDGALQLSLFDQTNLGEITSRGLSRRAADRVPQPARRRRARPQTRGALARDRARAGRDRRSAWSAARCTAPTRSGSRSGRRSSATRSKSTSRSRSPTPPSPITRKTEQIDDRSGAGRDLRAAHQRPRHRACPPARSCAPTRTSNRSSERSGPSKAPSSRSARSTTTSRTASARTCSSACSPTTSPGTYATPGRRCSSKTNSHPSSPTRSRKPPAPPPRSAKPSTKRTSTGEPCHSYKSLLAELATLTRNTIRLPGTTATFHKLAQPTTLQAHALDLAEHAPLDP